MRILFTILSFFAFGAHAQEPWQPFPATDIHLESSIIQRRVAALEQFVGHKAGEPSNYEKWIYPPTQKYGYHKPGPKAEIYAVREYQRFQYFADPQNENCNIETAENFYKRYADVRTASIVWQTDFTLQLLTSANVLLRAAHQTRYADDAEHLIYNALLGAIDYKRPGFIASTTLLATGSERVFDDPQARPNWSRYIAEHSLEEMFASFYQHDDSTIVVSQYVPSTLEWRERGVKLVVKTGFPRFDDIHLIIYSTSNKAMGLRLRIPQWATAGVSIRVNGQPTLLEPSASSYVTLRRVWNVGDSISLVMPRPMSSHRLAHGYPAFYLGPVLMTAPALPNGIIVLKPGAPDLISPWRLHPPHRLTYEAPTLLEPSDAMVGPFYDKREGKYQLNFPTK